MFRSSPAFASFSTNDVEATRDFYTRILGLEATEEMGMLDLRLGGGGHVLIYPKDDHEPAVFTVLNLPVDDIDAAVDRLSAAGVSFERYDQFDQDERGIARPERPEDGPAIAWFKDPAGNIVSVLEEPSRA